MFAAALGLRLEYVRQLGGTPYAVALVGDEQAYSKRAQTLLRDGWLAGDRPFYQDPLYSYALALVYRGFGVNLSAVRVLQCLLGALGSVALAWVAARSTGLAAGYVAGLSLALFPRAWFYDAQIEKTGPTVALTAIALASWWWAEQGGSRRWTAVGFVLGLLCLLRGNFMVLAPAAGLGCWLRAGSLCSVLWLTLATAVTVAPATVRNYLVSGELVLVTSQGGQNFFIGNWSGNDTGRYVPPPYLRPHPDHEEDDLARYAERELKRGLRAREVSAVYWRWGIAELARDPGKFLRSCLLRLIWLLHPDEVPDNNDERFVARLIPILVGARWWALVLLAAGVAGGLAQWKRSPLARLVLVFCALYCASLVAFFVFGRYRMPLFPALALGSGLWLDELARRGRARSWRRIVGHVTPVVVLLGASLFLPAVPDQDGQNWNTYGSALERAGNRPAARAAYATAATLDPTNPLAAYNVARILAKDGRLLDAVVEYRRSISLLPDLPESHFQLGVCLLELGDIEAAAVELARALELDPGLEPARVALARAEESRRDGRSLSRSSAP